MNTEKSRRKRINYLRQLQERRHFLSDFLLSLSRIAGTEISEELVLTLDETNAVINKTHYRDSQEPTLILSFPFSQSEKLREVFLSIVQDIADPKTYFTTSRYFNSMFLQLNSSFIIDSFEEIIELDTNSFYIYHKDLNNGLMIDSNEENWTENGKTEFVWTYELRTWGKAWVDKIYFAYNNLI